MLEMLHIKIAYNLYRKSRTNIENLNSIYMIVAYPSYVLHIHNNFILRNASNLLTHNVNIIMHQESFERTMNNV